MSGQAEARAAVRPRDVVERIHDLMARDDLSGQADLYAPNGVLERPLAPPGTPGRLQGRERIRRELLALQTRAERAGVRLLTGILSATIHETADPEVIVIELERCAEITTYGGMYQMPYMQVQVFRVREGEIVLCRDYHTPVDLLSRL